MTTTRQDLPVLNVDLLTEMVKWAGQDILDLEDHYKAMGWPEHYQGAWVQFFAGGEGHTCGSTACIAGNATAQSGKWMPCPYFEDFTKPLDDPARRPYWRHDTDWAVPITVTGYQSNGRPIYVRDETRTTDSIRAAGAEVLGLTPHEQVVLFDPDMSLGDIVAVARLIAERRGLTLDLPAELVERANPLWYLNGGFIVKGEDPDYSDLD
jgi:hypothetical protein